MIEPNRYGPADFYVMGMGLFGCYLFFRNIFIRVPWKRIGVAIGLGFAMLFRSPRSQQHAQGTFQVDEDLTDKLHRLEHKLCLPKWYGKPRCSTEELIREQHARQVAHIRKKRIYERAIEA